MIATSDYEFLISILQHRKTNWTTYKKIRVYTQQYRDKPWHRRYIADLAEESKGRIISTTHGYKLQDHATKQEILTSHRELMNKAKKTAERANKIIGYFHRNMDGKEPNQNAENDQQKTLF